MDLAGAVAGAALPEHGVDEFINAVLVCQQDIRRIPQGSAAFPVQKPFQMAKGLDAGDQLDAKKRRLFIEGTDVVCRISAPQIAEKGIAGQLIGILRIKIGFVIAHKRHAAEHPLHRLRGHDRVA